MKKIHYLIIFLLCLFFYFYIYGFNRVNELGIYSDDWVIPAFYKFVQPNNFSNFIIQSARNPYSWYRVLSMVISSIAYQFGNLINNHILALNITMIFLNAIILFLLFLLINKLIKDVSLSFLIAVFSVSFFGHSSTFFWFSTVMQLLAMISFILAVYLSLSKKIKEGLKIFLIFFLTLMSVWSYENTIILPIVIFIVNIERIKKAWLYLASSFLGAISMIVFKLFLFPIIFNVPNAKTLSLNNPNSFDYLVHIIEVYKKYLNVLGINGLLKNWILYIKLEQLLSTIVFVIAFFSLFIFIDKIFKQRDIFEKNNPAYISQIRVKKVIILGFVIFFLSYLFTALIIPTPDWIIPFGKSSRGILFHSVGISLWFSGLIAYFFYENKKAIYAILLVILCLNLSLLSLERNGYKQSWERQKEIIKKIKTLTPPDIEKKQSLFIAIITKDLTARYVSFDTPVLSDFWTVTGLLKTTLNNPTLEGDIYSAKRAIPIKKNKLIGNSYPEKIFSKDRIYVIDLDRKTGNYY